MSSMFLGIPAYQVAGHVWRSEYGVALLTDLSMDDPETGGGLAVFGHSHDGTPSVWKDDGKLHTGCGGDLLYCISRPNPMSTAPRCGKPVRLVFENENCPELLAAWWHLNRGSTGEWADPGDLDTPVAELVSKLAGFDELNSDPVGWLPAYGQTYDPAKMGGPET